jgi:hypothetical protein
MVQGCRARRAGLQNDDYEGKFKNQTRLFGGQLAAAAAMSKCESSRPATPHWRTLTVSHRLFYAYSSIFGYLGGRWCFGRMRHLFLLARHPHITCRPAISPSRNIPRAKSIQS